MLKVIATTWLLLLLLTHQAFGLEIGYPRKDSKHSTRSPTIAFVGKAMAGDMVVLEIVSGGVIQARETAIANAKGGWSATIKAPAAGWIAGPAEFKARVGKEEASVRITFVPR